MQQILCAIDGSLDAIEAAVSFARLMGPGERLFTVLYVIPPAGRRDDDPAAIAYYQQACTQAEALVGETVAHLLGAGLAAQSLVLYGDPAAMIVDTARTIRADLLVMAPHERQGLRRWLEGSVTKHVMAEAPCGVVAFRHAAVDHAALVRPS